MKNFTLAFTIISSLFISSANIANAFYGQENKTYLTGKLGLAANNAKTTYSNGITGSANATAMGAAAEVGVGYYILDELRVDFDGYFAKKLRSSKTFTSGVTRTQSNTKQRIVGGFVNLYYDFLNNSNITPYASVGLGFMRTELTSTLYSGAASEIVNKNLLSPAYSLGLGMSYHLASSYELDFGYRFTTPTKNKDKYIIFSSLNATGKFKPQGNHNFLIGIRHTF
jgi:opacity protein-like surface antigen